MLTEEAVKQAFQALDENGGCGKTLTYCGVKVTCFHEKTGEDVELRLQANADLLAVLQGCDPR